MEERRGTGTLCDLKRDTEVIVESEARARAYQTAGAGRAALKCFNEDRETTEAATGWSVNWHGHPKNRLGQGVQHVGGEEELPGWPDFD